MGSKKEVEPDGDKGSQPTKDVPAPPPPPVETDDFGLPIRRYPSPKNESGEGSGSDDSEDGDTKWADAPETAGHAPETIDESPNPKAAVSGADIRQPETTSRGGDGVHVDSKMMPSTSDAVAQSPARTSESDAPAASKPESSKDDRKTTIDAVEAEPADDIKEPTVSGSAGEAAPQPTPATSIPQPEEPNGQPARQAPRPSSPRKTGHGHQKSIASMSSVNEGGVSKFSHHQLSTQHEAEVKDEDDGWQQMPSYARYDMYDDDDRLIAREYNGEEDDETFAYGGLGGAGKGYTRVQLDEDALSATSMDDNTQYLFKDGGKGTAMVDDGDEEARDAVSQMQATKDLLTEGQRIAYVGVVRLEIANLVKDGEELEAPRKVKKEVSMSAESLKMWGQKMMIRLYAHMDISEAEQVMIEQLADHGVVPHDLVPALHANARVQNPMAGREKETGGETEAASPPVSPVDAKSAEPSLDEEAPTSPETPADENLANTSPGAGDEKASKSLDGELSKSPPSPDGEEVAEPPPPPYQGHEGDEVPDVQTPSQMPSTEKIDIDLRWTVLCDLFLILIADSVYDSRSRVLLERVGKSLDVPWVDICRFEKRVTDALEMQQAAEKENWNEEEHMENRRKRALKKRYMMLGLATAGGGLVIGLSAGLLAPVIGAGLAAGFSTIGVAGTSGFLGGVGGAAVITSSAAASGGVIGARAANRRTGAVKTFEYRPLHNNKRVNLIVTVSGWLTGKVDDVRLPFSTVDSVMGDLYSVLWEPEMLRSMGDTIRILATEALTQSIQQILGSTILAALMGALQLPIVLTKLSYLIDNPWTVSLDRATAAGKILADSLIERNLGTRPITLVGYSLGSRVIFSCLQELSKRGAYGLVQNVYLFGSPMVVNKEEYIRARTVVPGRFVNGYNRTDWILGYLFRLTNGGIRRVAGLAAIEDLPWIENFDVTEFVPGHMEYRTAMPTLLMHCGWSVESEEFTEIEDPDPDNHNARQRELINEIDEARKALEEEGKAEKRSKFSLFGRRKKAEKQEWEVYEGNPGKQSDDKDRDSAYQGALFDVDAIRAELAKEAKQGSLEEEIQVREIKSTLPPMKLDISANPHTSSSTPTATTAPHSSLRETRSADHVPIHHPGDDEIQMTFDTAFDDSKPTTSYSKGEHQSRPEMKAAQTLPNITLDDPWGDPEDEDFGKEKEISMTFA